MKQRMHYPGWIKVRQRLYKEKVENPGSFTERQLKSMVDGIGPLTGRQIAVTVGSRSIANLVEITRAICDFLKSCGALPFLVPAMGSYGGATSDGQKEILKGGSALPSSAWGFPSAPAWMWCCWERWSCRSS